MHTDTFFISSRLCRQGGWLRHIDRDNGRLHRHRHNNWMLVSSSSSYIPFHLVRLIPDADLAKGGYGSGTGDITGTGTVWPAEFRGILSFVTSGTLHNVSGAFSGCGTVVSAPGSLNWVLGTRSSIELIIIVTYRLAAAPLQHQKDRR